MFKHLYKNACHYLNGCVGIFLLNNIKGNPNPKHKAL